MTARGGEAPPASSGQMCSEDRQRGVRTSILSSNPHPLHHLHKGQQRLILEADVFKNMNEVGEVEVIPPVLHEGKAVRGQQLNPLRLGSWHDSLGPAFGRDCAANYYSPPFTNPTLPTYPQVGPLVLAAGHEVSSLKVTQRICQPEVGQGGRDVEDGQEGVVVYIAEPV